MPCTTFLHDCELNVKTSSHEINILLSKVREETGEDWQVIERQIIKHSFWKGDTTIKTFSVYKYVGGMGPWQCINFCTSDSHKESLAGITGVDECTVVNYFYGILAGTQAMRLKIHD